MKAVVKHATMKWEVLYIERWLKAEVVTQTGEVQFPKKGTPQGAVISPLLANLFLHYAFDKWMERELPRVPFERYADDAIVHCASEAQARMVFNRIRKRMQKVGLELNLEKTKIVHCLNSLSRDKDYPLKKFTLLGFDFKPRSAKDKRGGLFTAFTPAVGVKAQQRILRTVRQLRLRSTVHLEISTLADRLNPPLRGWVNYFRHFRPSSMDKVLFLIDLKLTRWLRLKYKLNLKTAVKLLRRIKHEQPNLFAHWPHRTSIDSMGRAV
jgi:group II intron reverse transcriptase/maturase